MTDSEQMVLVIDRRLDSARQEIATLQAARAAMTGGDPAGPASPAASVRARARTAGPAASAPARPRRAKRLRRSQPVDAAAVELALAGADAMTSSAVAEQTAGARPRVLGVLRELEAAGRVRRSGQRRGTRWHLVTDEDRIAARAAQLAEQQRGAKTKRPSPRRPA